MNICLKLLLILTFSLPFLSSTVNGQDGEINDAVPTEAAPTEADPSDRDVIDDILEPEPDDLADLESIDEVEDESFDDRPGGPVMDLPSMEPETIEGDAGDWRIPRTNGQLGNVLQGHWVSLNDKGELQGRISTINREDLNMQPTACLLYTSPSPRDATLSRMPSSA